LRTRVEKNGMNFKGFNIAVHEMGHNVEQTLSMNDIDHYFLNGVPNTAFTEAIAFVFQSHDLDLLGLSTSNPQGESLKTLNDFWAVYEIAGVALVDIEVWHWMYDHPTATPAQLKTAVLDIAKNMWNTYYASVFKKKDVLLLAIYSHMIDSYMYLPDYPLGHLIAHQIEEQVKKSGSVGKEVERMVQSGCIAPDLWMKNATGLPVSAQAMLEATERALKEHKK
jgi:oligoendopeptidase F